MGPLCDAKFSQQSDFVYHMSINHIEWNKYDQLSSVHDEKKHKCFICGTDFEEKEQLLRHFETNFEEHMAIVEEGHQFETLKEIKQNLNEIEETTGISQLAKENKSQCDSEFNFGTESAVDNTSSFPKDSLP